MFQVPGTPGMIGIVHDVELAEATRRARFDRERAVHGHIRLRIGRALISIGVALTGERPEPIAGDEWSRALMAPAAGVKPVTDGECWC